MTINKKDRMERKDIIIALAHRQDVQKDVDALVCKIAGIDAENKVIDFIRNSSEIWIDTGRADLQKEAGVNEYLNTFEQYEKLWASRKNEGTSEKNWYKMQEELAKYITTASLR